MIATFRTESIKLFQGLKNTEMRLDLNLEEIIKFYSEGDILYFPSLYEGFEMVTLEALVSGIPVLGNDVGGILN
ncbi:glycosyltransferase [Fusobacterium varium]|uniref:glycosyltransferase n=1 Tax=Fusobacterium varium TaxID=856 RepID=UPI002FF2D6DC